MPKLKALTGRCLEKKLSDRLRTAQALKHPFFLPSADEFLESMSLEPLNPANPIATCGITRSFLLKGRPTTKNKADEQDVEQEASDNEYWGIDEEDGGDINLYASAAIKTLAGTAAAGLSRSCDNSMLVTQ